MVTERRRSPAWHLAQALAPLTPGLPPTKALAASTLQWKKQPVFTSDSSLPPKPKDTHRLHREVPTQGHTFKTWIGNCSPNFIETDKVKQNEKTEEYVSNERKRKKSNETEKNNSPDKEFEAIIRRMLTELGERMMNRVIILTKN